MLRGFAGIGLAMLLGAGGASAQEWEPSRPPAIERGSTGMGVFLGYSKAEDAERGTLHVGASYSIRPFDVLGVVAEVGYRRDELEKGGAVVDASVTYVPLLLSLQLFPAGRTFAPLVPYVMGGGGAYITTVRVVADLGGERRKLRDADFETGWHAGAGLDFEIGPYVTFSGDLRWVDLDAELGELPRDADADGIWVTGGIKFFF